MASCAHCGDYRSPKSTKCHCGHVHEESYEDATGNVDAVKPGAGIIAAGWAMLIAGAVVAGMAILMKTSVSTGISYGSEVQNIGLLQNQMMMFHGGISAAVAGVFCVAIGSAVRALRTEPK